MDKNKSFDFWYAVNNTEVLLTPSRHLETFGTTVLNYHIVSEMMDSVDQIRIREGMMRAHRPQIITPEAYAKTALEGFGEEAHKYIDWLKEHEKEIKILQYGYSLKNESFTEHLVSGSLKAIAEKVRDEVKEKNDMFSAVVIGVDKPWDVCLVKLFWEIIQRSAQENINELARQRLFDMDGNLPRGVRRDIETAFLAASKNPKLLKRLGKMLHEYGIFDEYQDRFFSLVKANTKPT
jgi:hypothetical protein